MQRYWDESVAKSKEPMKSFNEIFAEINQARLSPVVLLDDSPDIDWLRAT